MRAMQVKRLGGPLEPAQAPRPVPGVGEILLRHRAVGLNFADLLMIEGHYQEKPALPFVPGMEIAGEVAARTEGAETFRPGDRVACFAGSGGLAEYSCIPAPNCVPVPDAMSDSEAAAFLVAYGTAHLALGHRARLRAGERLLVLGAAGGVGLTAVEIGKLMGAEVIACARGGEKLAVAARAGADHLIDSTDADLCEAVRALGGADVVYDPVGGDQFRAAMRAANPEARLIPLGFASGEVPQIPANILMVKNLDVIGLYWGGYARFRPDVAASSIDRLFRWYEEGRLRPHVSHVLPLDRAADALALLGARKSTGKVVVTI